MKAFWLVVVFVFLCFSTLPSPTSKSSGTMIESPPPFLTVIGLLLGVNNLMLSQLGAVAEGLPTGLAHVGFLPRVDPVMHGEVRDPLESPPARLAWVGFLSRVDSLVLLQL